MRKYDRLIYILAIIKFVIPYLLQSNYYEPHRDEFLYLAQGHHVAWGFMEVPPLLSIFAWLTHLLGGGIFWIKFWPDLFGAFTFIITAKIIQTLGGKSFANFPCLSPICFWSIPALVFLFSQTRLKFFLDNDRI